MQAKIDKLEVEKKLLIERGDLEEEPDPKKAKIEEAAPIRTKEESIAQRKKEEAERAERERQERDLQRQKEAEAQAEQERAKVDRTDRAMNAKDRYLARKKAAAASAASGNAEGGE